MKTIGVLLLLPFVLALRLMKAQAANQSDIMALLFEHHGGKRQFRPTASTASTHSTL